MPEAAATVPMPDDLVLMLASETPDAASYSGEVDLSAADLVEFYRAALPDAGFQIAEIVEPSSGVIVIRFNGQNSTGELAVSETPNGLTTVIVGVSRA